ncbi:MAG TPA: hypothetical protein VF600_06580 [Abditibacteriaceae bacterium]|jgi:hypothetical protein
MCKRERQQEIERLTTLYRRDIEDILSKPHDLRATLVKALTDSVYVGGQRWEASEAYTNVWASSAEPHWIDVLLDIMLAPPPFRQSIGEDWWDNDLVLFTAQVAQMYPQEAIFKCLPHLNHPELHQDIVYIIASTQTTEAIQYLRPAIDRAASMDAEELSNLVDALGENDTSEATAVLQNLRATLEDRVLDGDTLHERINSYLTRLSA